MLSAQKSLISNREGNRPLVLADILHHLIRERRLKIAAGPDGRGKPTLVEVPEQEGLMITHEDLEKALGNVLVDLPYWPDLDAVLVSSGALVEVREGAFLFRRRWLEKHWKQVRLVQSGMVKIHA